MADIHEETRAVSILINELILAQLHDLKEEQRELKAEIKTTRDELNKRIDRIENRIDRLENKMDTSTNHEQIAAISNIGIGVAAASSTIFLLYSLLSK